MASPGQSDVASPLDALAILDAMIGEEAEASSRMAVAFPEFERYNGATGAGIRLLALNDARQRILSEALRLASNKKTRGAA